MEALISFIKKKLACRRTTHITQQRRGLSALEGPVLAEELGCPEHPALSLHLPGPSNNSMRAVSCIDCPEAL